MAAIVVGALILAIGVVAGTYLQRSVGSPLAWKLRQDRDHERGEKLRLQDQVDAARAIAEAVCAEYPDNRLKQLLGTLTKRRDRAG